MRDTRVIDLNGPVNVADFGGSGQPIVCVHGLGGSHVNWMATAPHLSRLGHVIAIDLPGFGLSPPAGRSTSLESNRQVLDRFLATFDEPVWLVGNSMGGAISMMEAAANPGRVSRLVLVSPVSPHPAEVSVDPVVSALFGLYAIPGLARGAVGLRRRAIDPAEAAMWTLRLCAANVHRIAPSVLTAHVELARQRAQLAGIDGAFVAAARSTLAFAMNRRRLDEVVARIETPTLLVQGDQDRLVRYPAAERIGRLRPDWQVEILEDVGHVAMLEVPVTFAGLVESWVKR